MRWPWLVALSLAAAPAEARPRAQPAEADDFWHDVLEPHAETVAAILHRAGPVIHRATSATPDGNAFADTERRLRDAYGMLRHARALAPDNVEVLRLLGIAADELGRTAQAIDTLEACVRVAGPERAGVEVTGRLGMIYLRLGRLDDAIRWLRHAQGTVSTAPHAANMVYLAAALAARGQMTDAIDALTNALPAQVNYLTDPLIAVNLALAVHDDRNDEPGAAFEILDRMQATLQQDLAPFAQRTLGELRFAPAEDQYYYHAMLDEALGDYIEARAEWALYAAVTDAPWRRRALEHIQAIDTQRRAQPARTRSPSAGSPLSPKVVP